MCIYILEVVGSNPHRSRRIGGNTDSLRLLNDYADRRSFREALEELEKGMKINGKYINSVQYADDKVLTADSIEALQLILDKVNEAGIRYGLDINEKKTKWTVETKSQVLRS